jgi:hypothetical protein
MQQAAAYAAACFPHPVMRILVGRGHDPAEAPIPMRCSFSAHIPDSATILQSNIITWSAGS